MLRADSAFYAALLFIHITKLTEKKHKHIRHTVCCALQTFVQSGAPTVTKAHLSAAKQALANDDDTSNIIDDNNFNDDTHDDDWMVG